MTNKKQVLSISLESANAKETNRPYTYVSVKVEGIEITRIFIKETEKSYFSSLIGNFEKVDTL